MPTYKILKTLTGRITALTTLKILTGKITVIATPKILTGKIIEIIITPKIIPILRNKTIIIKIDTIPHDNLTQRKKNSPNKILAIYLQNPWI